MTLPLTPALLQASYNFLRQTPPFKRWKMPPGDSVRFRVTRSVVSRGSVRGASEIDISSYNIGRTESLMMVMAHEMVHVHVHLLGNTRSEHGAEWMRCARQVCRYHGFDPKLF